MELLVVLVGYLAGCVPTAALVGRRAGFDPQRQGSGNPGATNALRLGGVRAGASVLCIDVAKGALPTAAGIALGGTDLGVLAGACAVLGHVHPLGRSGEGGKGVATAAGMAMVAVPGAALVALASFVALIAATRVVSLGSVAAAVSLPVAALLLGHPLQRVAVLGVVALVVVVRHRGNLARVRHGTEPLVGVTAGDEEA